MYIFTKLFPHSSYPFPEYLLNTIFMRLFIIYFFKLYKKTLIEKMVIVVSLILVSHRLQGNIYIPEIYQLSI